MYVSKDIDCNRFANINTILENLQDILTLGGTCINPPKMYESKGWNQLLHVSGWRHQMETFSALLAIWAGNSPVTGEFPAQRPVTRILDVFFDLRLNKRLYKQSCGWWFETPSGPLWRHCNVTSPVLMSTCINWDIHSMSRKQAPWILLFIELICTYIYYRNAQLTRCEIDMDIFATTSFDKFVEKSHHHIRALLTWLILELYIPFLHIKASIPHLYRWRVFHWYQLLFKNP